MDERDAVQIVREALTASLGPKATPHHEMPPYMQRAQKQTNTAHVALDTLAASLIVAEQERCRRPSDEGGPGKEEVFWLGAKLNASIRHLRDIEDYYRVELGGTPDSPNMDRADRARSLYEQISDDFLNGKRKVPTMRERAETAEGLSKKRLAIIGAMFKVANNHPELTQEIISALAALSPDAKDEKETK